MVYGVYVKNTMSINRNILECKLYGNRKKPPEVFVLIETYWNVNFCGLRVI